MGLIKLIEDLLASASKLIQDMLWLHLLLPDCFTLDAMLKIEPAQTSHSNLFVHNFFAEALRKRCGRFAEAEISFCDPQTHPEPKFDEVSQAPTIPLRSL